MKLYVIWSNEHGSWWKSNRCGYSRHFDLAGRYTFEEAQQICADANRYLRDFEERKEVLMLAPESLPKHGLTDEAVEAVTKAYINVCMDGLWEAFSEPGRENARRDMRKALEGLAAEGWVLDIGSANA